MRVPNSYRLILLIALGLWIPTSANPAQDEILSGPALLKAISTLAPKTMEPTVDPSAANSFVPLVRAATVLDSVMEKWNPSLDPDALSRAIGPSVVDPDRQRVQNYLVDPALTTLGVAFEILPPSEAKVVADMLGSAIDFVNPEQAQLC